MKLGFTPQAKAQADGGGEQNAEAIDTIRGRKGKKTEELHDLHVSPTIIG
jgi:hypothetical protein